MVAFLRSLLLGAHGLWAYGAIFSVLVACGLGVPLPEDMSLLLGGYLAHRGASLAVMVLVGFAGILAGDALIFFAGRRIGARAARAQGWVARVVTSQKRAKVEALFRRHGQKIVLIARFLPGIRAVAFFTAGSAGMRFWAFLFYDGLAALASGPVLVYLGFRFGHRLEEVVERVKQGQLAIIGLLVAFGLASLLWRRVKARRARQRLREPLAVAPELYSARARPPHRVGSERSPLSSSAPGPGPE